MRVTNLLNDVQYNIQQSAQNLQTALQQLSTGKRINQLADDPSASANYVRSTYLSASADQYTSNVNTIQSQLQTADSALSSVVTSLNQAIGLGTQGANGTLTDANRQSIATQVQGVLSTIVDQANISFQGKYLFAGTNTDVKPFAADSTSPSGYVYNGNSTINKVEIGESFSVTTGLDGNKIFSSSSDVIGSLGKLISSLQSGSTTDIGNAVTSVTNALNYVNQQRVPLSNTLNQLNAQETYLSQEKVTLSTQQTSLVGIDTATAATNVSQASAANNAVLAAAAKVIPQTLLNYLQ